MAFGTATDMVVSAALVVVGSLAATMATDWAKTYAVDFSVKGGDAIYPFTGAMMLLALMNTRTTRTIALGMIASSVTVVAEDFGLA